MPAAVRWAVSVDIERSIVSLLRQRGAPAPVGVQRAPPPNPRAPRAGPVRARAAQHPHEVERARRLVERRYAWRGYVLADGLAACVPDSAGEIALVALHRDRTVGTMTLRVDGPHGLLAEQGYAEVVQRKRGEGRRICEFTRLAVAEDAPSTRVLASLFGLAYVIGTGHGANGAFVEVNPRHARFYTRVLGFTVAGPERVCERVSATSVLLWLELEQLHRRLTSVRADPLAFAMRAAQQDKSGTN